MRSCDKCLKEYNDEEEGILVTDNYTGEENGFCSKLCLMEYDEW